MRLDYHKEIAIKTFKRNSCVFSWTNSLYHFVSLFGLFVFIKNWRAIAVKPIEAITFKSVNLIIKEKIEIKKKQSHKTQAYLLAIFISLILFISLATSASAAPVTTNDYWKIVFDEGIDAPNNYSTTFTPKVRLYDQGNNLVTDGALSCSYYDVNARQSIPCTVNNNGDGSYSGSAIDMQARIGHYINVQFSVSAGSNIIREGHVFYAGESYAARGALWKIEVFDTSSGPSWDGASTQNVYMKLYSDAATLISNNFQTPTITITNAAGLTQATGNMVYEGHGVYSYSISGYTNGEYYFEIFNRWSGAPTGGKNQYVETYAGLYLEANNAQGDESSPEIVSIERDLYFPVDNDYVDITAYAVDNVNIVSATLNYSVNNQQFQTVPMVAQSGIEYIGQLSPHLLEDNVRYSVEINDGTGIASSEWFMYNVQDHRGEPNMTHSFLNHPVYWFGKTRQAALGDVGGDANYDGTYSTNAGDIDGVVYLHFAQDYQYFRDQTFIKVQTLVMDETGKPLEHLTNVTAWLSPNATQAPGTHNREKNMTEVPGETGVYTTTWEGSPAILSGGSTYVWNDDARAIWGQYTSGEIYSVYIDIGDGGIPEENITWLAYNFGDTFWNSGAEGKGLSHVESTKTCNKDCHGMAGTVRGDMTCPDCHGVYKAANNGVWPVDTGNDAVDTAIVYGNSTGHPRQDVINKTTCGDDTCHDVAWGSTPVPNDVIIPGYIMGAQIDETFQSDYPNTAQCGEHHNYNSLKIPIEAGHNRMITCKYCHGGSHSNNLLADYDILNTDVSSVDRGTPGYVGSGGETSNTLAGDCYIDCHKTQVEHSLIGMSGDSEVNVVVPCDECHENYNNAPAHQESLAPYPDRETCGSCHQAQGNLTAYNTSFSLDPPRIPQTQLHAQESGTMWNNTGTRPYWVENEQSCRYCHGRSYNEAYGMGRIEQFMGTNIINGSIDSNSYWCASCHVDNATDIHYDYNSMVEVYNYTFGVVPPEITGSKWMSTRSGYDDHQLSGYLDRSNSSTYSDIICFSCHGSLLSLSDGMDVFQHEVSPNVGEDVTPPVITLLGKSPIDVEVGSVYVDAGATALDDVDGDLTSSIVTVNPVDNTTIGTYIVTYDVNDSSNNAATQVTRTVNVIAAPDTTPPVITLVGSDPVTIEVGSIYIDAGATALDDVDGDLTSSIVTVNPVDNITIGTYIVTYDVNDSSSNAATQVTRTVNVVDTTPPVITLVGSDPVTIEVDTVYIDAGATALDTYDGDLTGSIVTVNPVDNTTVGTYIVTYDVNDSSSNAATQVTRTVNIVDTTPPTIVSVNLNTTTPKADDDLLVTVNATDAGGVVSVEANGVSLTDQGSDIWSGIITAIAGTHSVNVSATDGDTNVAWDNSTSYSTAGLTGTISGKVTK